jgi:hypothetical protein
MKKELIGMMTAVSLMGFGIAHAGDKQGKKWEETSAQESQSGQVGAESDAQIGGSGQVGTQPMAGESELTGKVVRSDAKTVWIDHMGAVVPLTINASTVFEGGTITRARDLKEGQEVRASFEVQNKTSNVAKTISLNEGQGGSGMEPQGSDVGGSGMETPMGSDPDLSGSSTTPAEPERGPGTPVPEEPGTQPTSPTY